MMAVKLTTWFLGLPKTSPRKGGGRARSRGLEMPSNAARELSTAGRCGENFRLRNEERG